MTRLQVLLVFIAISCAFACNNDFDLIEEGVDYPVVYGFINITDTAQYIRVEKGFADENTNAVTLAQDPDAVYYDNVDVTITNQRTNQTYTLTKVNAADEGYTRDPGDFLVDPNYVFKIPTDQLDFVGGERALLTLTPADGSTPTTGLTRVLQPIKVLMPNPTDPVIEFGAREFRIQVEIADSASIIGVRLRMRVRENEILNPTEVDTVEVVWDVTRNFINPLRNNFLTMRFNSSQFFQELANNLDASKQVNRRFVGLDIELNYAGPETLEFRRIALANGGLTGSLELPNYTNLTNGTGVFGSKVSRILKDIAVTNRTRDSLANGQLTGDLNFVF